MGFLSKVWRTVSLGSFGSKGLIGKALGLGEQPDLAAMDMQLKAAAEAAKLQAANEATNVVRFDEAAPTAAAGGDMRRKKQRTGGYAASSLGLNV